jgi:hypothetical protein
MADEGFGACVPIAISLEIENRSFMENPFAVGDEKSWMSGGAET